MHRSRLFQALAFAAAMSGSPALNAARVPWTTSRIQGSPEPPPPYVAERVFPMEKLNEATELAFVPDSTWGLLLDRSGKLFGFNQTKPQRLELIANFSDWGGERMEGYSLEFHPDWKNNHHVFLALLDQKQRPPHVLVARFKLELADRPMIDLSSGLRIIDWESTGHNGSDLQFGPDGMLYISAGDGEVPAPPDPRKTGQDVSDLLASVMRIDVTNATADRPYQIPADNPFVGQPGTRPEIWAYGFRNPWKMSFDPRDGALWIGDVGWELWEMVFRVDHGGFNGGWSIVEGPQSIHPDWKAGPTPIEEPVVSHPHTEATSITGGLVYQGSRLPELKNAYIYGDWGSGKIWALWWEQGRIVRHRELASTPHRIIGFAADANDELFYADYADGAVYQLVPNPDQTIQTDFPTRLSETGLFADTAAYELAPGVEPFEITAPMWSDHATARRAVAYPGMEKAGTFKGVLKSPTNAVYVRTLSLEMEAGNPETSQRIETQLMHFDGREWNWYSFRWNDEQTDATLVDKDGDTRLLTVRDPESPGGLREQSWRFHARAECIRCHQNLYQEQHGNLNAFSLPQLASLRHDDGRRELDRLIEAGFIEPSVAGQKPRELVDPADDTAPLDRRARSYLHANCAHCHRPGSTGAVTMYWPVEFDEKQTGALDLPPVRGTFDIADARIVAPGKPNRSTLLYRLLTTGTGHMPMIGAREIDDKGASLIAAWIKSLKPEAAEPLPDSVRDTASAIEFALAMPRLSPSLRKKVLQEATGSQLVAVTGLFERFLPPDQRRQVLGPDFDPQTVLALQGNAARGRELFFGANGPQCFNCHRKNGNGRDFGPDLSTVADKYNRALLLTQIIQPALVVDPAWKTLAVETKEDESITGFLAGETDNELRVKTALGTEIVVSKSSIIDRLEPPGSLMPEGTLDTLTAQEAADLLEFLLH